MIFPINYCLFVENICFIVKYRFDSLFVSRKVVNQIVKLNIIFDIKSKIEVRLPNTVLNMLVPVETIEAVEIY